MCAVLALDWDDKGSCCFHSLICDGLFFLKSCVELASSSLLTFRIVCHCCLVSGGNDSQACTAGLSLARGSVSSAGFPR